MVDSLRSNGGCNVLENTDREDYELLPMTTINTLELKALCSSSPNESFEHDTKQITNQSKQESTKIPHVDDQTKKVNEGKDDANHSIIKEENKLLSIHDCDMKEEKHDVAAKLTKSMDVDDVSLGNVEGSKVPTLMKDVLPHLLCGLCKGYLVDATSIIICLHTFCRSCIVRYLQHSIYCPECEVLIHQTAPHTKLLPDDAKQALLHTLHPQLYHDEVKRRKCFSYSKSEKLILPSAGNYSSVLLPEDQICIEVVSCSQNKHQKSRYFQCASAVTMKHLKSLIFKKFNLTHNSNIVLLIPDKRKSKSHHLVKDDLKKSQMDCKEDLASENKAKSEIFSKNIEMPEVKTSTNSETKESDCNQTKVENSPTADGAVLSNLSEKEKAPKSENGSCPGILLLDYETLRDVACMLQWTQNKPLKIFYKIFSNMKAKETTKFNISCEPSFQIPLDLLSGAEDHEPCHYMVQYESIRTDVNSAIKRIKTEGAIVKKKSTVKPKSRLKAKLACLSKDNPIKSISPNKTNNISNNGLIVSSMTHQQLLLMQSQASSNIQGQQFSLVQQLMSMQQLNSVVGVQSDMSHSTTPLNLFLNGDNVYHGLNLPQVNFLGQPNALFNPVHSATNPVDASIFLSANNLNTPTQNGFGVNQPYGFLIPPNFIYLNQASVSPNNSLPDEIPHTPIITELEPSGEQKKRVDLQCGDLNHNLLDSAPKGVHIDDKNGDETSCPDSSDWKEVQLKISESGVMSISGSGETDLLEKLVNEQIGKDTTSLLSSLGSPEPLITHLADPQTEGNVHLGVMTSEAPPNSSKENQLDSTTCNDQLNPMSNSSQENALKSKKSVYSSANKADKVNNAINSSPVEKKNTPCLSTNLSSDISSKDDSCTSGENNNKTHSETPLKNKRKLSKSTEEKNKKLKHNPAENILPDLLTPVNRPKLDRSTSKLKQIAEKQKFGNKSSASLLLNNIDTPDVKSSSQVTKSADGLSGTPVKPSKKIKLVRYRTLNSSPRGWNPTLSTEMIKLKARSTLSPTKTNKFFKARNSSQKYTNQSIVLPSKIDISSISNIAKKIIKKKDISVSNSNDAKLNANICESKESVNCTSNSTSKIDKSLNKEGNALKISLKENKTESEVASKESTSDCKQEENSNQTQNTSEPSNKTVKKEVSFGNESTKNINSSLNEVSKENKIELNLKENTLNSYAPSSRYNSFSNNVNRCYTSSASSKTRTEIRNDSSLCPKLNSSHLMVPTLPHLHSSSRVNSLIKDPNSGSRYPQRNRNTSKLHTKYPLGNKVSSESVDRSDKQIVTSKSSNFSQNLDVLCTAAEVLTNSIESTTNLSQTKTLKNTKSESIISESLHVVTTSCPLSTSTGYISSTSSNVLSKSRLVDSLISRVASTLTTNSADSLVSSNGTTSTPSKNTSSKYSLDTNFNSLEFSDKKPVQSFTSSALFGKPISSCGESLLPSGDLHTSSVNFQTPINSSASTYVQPILLETPIERSVERKTSCETTVTSTNTKVSFTNKSQRSATESQSHFTKFPVSSSQTEDSSPRQEKLLSKREEPSSRPKDLSLMSLDSSTKPGVSSSKKSDSSVGPYVSSAGPSVPSVGSSVPSVGSSVSSVGSSVPSVGSSVSSVGSSVPSVGSSVPSVGSSVPSVGSSVPSVGSSVPSVGSCISSVGSCISSVGSCISSVGSCISSAGSCISSAESCISSAESCISSAGSCISSAGSCISSAGSCISSVEPSVSSVGPSVSSVGPSVSSVGPSVSSAGPSVSSAGLSVSSAGPSVSSAGPSVSSAGPSVSLAGPSVSLAGPSVSSAGPSVSSAGPSVSSAGPSVSSAGPSVSSAGPSVSSAGPSVSSAGPSVSSAGPSVSSSGPSVSSAGPSVSSAGPSFYTHLVSSDSPKHSNSKILLTSSLVPVSKSSNMVSPSLKSVVSSSSPKVSSIISINSSDESLFIPKVASSNPFSQLQLPSPLSKQVSSDGLRLPSTLVTSAAPTTFQSNIFLDISKASVPSSNTSPDQSGKSLVSSNKVSVTSMNSTSSPTVSSITSGLSAIVYPASKYVDSSDRSIFTNMVSTKSQSYCKTSAYTTNSVSCASTNSETSPKITTSSPIFSSESPLKSSVQSISNSTATSPADILNMYSKLKSSSTIVDSPTNHLDMGRGNSSASNTKFPSLSDASQSKAYSQFAYSQNMENSYYQPYFSPNLAQQSHTSSNVSSKSQQCKDKSFSPVISEASSKKSDTTQQLKSCQSSSSGKTSTEMKTSKTAVNKSILPTSLNDEVLQSYHMFNSQYALSNIMSSNALQQKNNFLNSFCGYDFSRHFPGSSSQSNECSSYSSTNTHSIAYGYGNRYSATASDPSRQFNHYYNPNYFNSSQNNTSGGSSSGSSTAQAAALNAYLANYSFNPYNPMTNFPYLNSFSGWNSSLNLPKTAATTSTSTSNSTDNPNNSYSPSLFSNGGQSMSGFYGNQQGNFPYNGSNGYYFPTAFDYLSQSSCRGNNSSDNTNKPYNSTNKNTPYNNNRPRYGNNVNDKSHSSSSSNS